MAIKRILFDTNIIIKREDPNVLPADFIELNKTINDLNYKIYVHPLSVKDVNRDKNEARKKISLSKLETYSQIQKAPSYDKDSYFKNIIGIEKNENDTVDNSLLYTVYKNAVDYLITEDKGIHVKAQRLSIHDKVLTINDAILIISKDISIKEQTLLSCFDKVKGWNINLFDTIFDSLKEEYGQKEFVEWWNNKVSGTERDVYVYFSEESYEKDKIKAILVLKEEENEKLNTTPIIILEDVLKICLFKVDSSGRGLRLGERLLKMAFEEARLKNKSRLYLTHFTKNNDDKLVSLIETYGFQFFTKLNNGESVYYKEIKPEKECIVSSLCDVVEANKQYFPSYYDGNIVSKYIVPVQPGFFEKLFPDCVFEDESSTQLQLAIDIKQTSKYTSEGFSLQKAYICNANIRTMKEGDILCFYRSEDYKSILALGTIEKVYYNISEADEIYKLIKRRTVYTIDEIKYMCSKSKPPVVILFKHNLNFDKEVPYSDLISKKIVNGRIQSILKIKDDKLYKEIIQGNIDESLIINKT